MRVAIIGNGIVAAFAAAAARDSGVSQIHIYSPREGFTLPPAGAFYLHELPGVMVPQPAVPMLELRLGADPSHYSRIMGVVRETSIDRMPASVVRGVFMPTQDVFDQLASGNITWFSNTVMTTGGLRQLLRSYDAVVCTVNIAQDEFETPAALTNIGVIPLHTLRDGHIEILSQYVQFNVSELMTLMEAAPYCSVYNAHEGSWLRYTSFDAEDLRFLEIPAHIALDTPSIIPVIKVPKLAENTQSRFSLQRRLILAGRFATWNRKDLSHHAYYQVQSGIKDLRETT